MITSNLSDNFGIIGFQAVAADPIPWIKTRGSPLPNLSMAKSDGYFPVWDGMLKKRFDKNISTEVPVTIIFGDTDHTLPAKTCQERSLAPAHAKWIVLPETGHAPMWDSTEEVVAEILETTKLRK